jgi:uncharacterized protein YycO
MKVAFFRGRHPGVEGWLGVLTKWWMRGDFSHAELVVGMDGTKGQCLSSTFLDKGVRAATIDLDDADWVLVDVPTTPEQEAAAVAWFNEHMGQPYDVRGLFGFVLRRIPGDKGKWFCSEAVAASLGFDEPWRFDPCTFYAVLTRR